jgi:hypothetical protein
MSMTDKGGIPSGYTVITPSDTTQLNFCGLLVVGAGDLVWKGQTADAAVTYSAAPAGTTIVGHVSVVMAATTATVLGAKY